MDEHALIYPWHLIGEPPESQLLIYKQVWHLELVLRHVAFASLRRTYGGEWEQAMNSASTNSKGKKTGLGNKAKETRDRQKVPGVHNIVWYLTTSELLSLYNSATLWKDCFAKHFPSLHREDFVKLDEQLRDLRNPWAHFRPPGDVEEEFSRLRDFVILLSPPLRAWYCAYWNHDPITKPDHPIVKQYAGSIPIALHTNTGFWERDWLEDRGWKFFLEINEARDCYWINPMFIGTGVTFGLSSVFAFAEALGPRLTHVMINFSKHWYAEAELEHHGIDDLIFGIPCQDGETHICETLVKASDFILNHITVAQEPHSAGSSASVLPHVQSEVFRRAPANVLPIPTLDERMDFQIGG